jgi:hypothetical protein
MSDEGTYVLGYSDAEHDLDADVEFDAIVGRYVLLYLPHPAETLRRVARLLRAGGILVFHEIDLTELHPSWPACELWDDSYRLLTKVFRAAGAQPDFGRRLNRTFLDAGLPGPEIQSLTPVGAGPDSMIVDWLAMSLLSLQPALTAAELTLPAGLSYDALLGDRLGTALAEQGSQIIGPAQYGAWARKPAHVRAG